MGWTRAGVLVVCGLLCGTGVARADSTHSCGEPPEESHYVAQSGDSEDAQHFTAERVFNGEGRLELNVCSGELHIEPGKGDHLKLRIEVGATPSLRMRAYVKTFDIANGQATISLEFPHRLHPVVVLELPSTTSLKSQINLGAGKIYFDANGVKGDRELNLGAGSAYLRMLGDHDYADFEANVGMGSFHDHRPGGSNSHFIISREYHGAGDGRLEMNVGAGSIDIDPVGGTI